MNTGSKIFIPAVATVIIHGFIFFLVAVGWEAQSKPKRIIPPNYIKAELVQLENKTKKKASAKKKPKKVDLTAKRKEQARLKREAEKKRLAKIKKEKEAAAKKAADEKKKAEEAERKERETQAQREREREQRMQQEFEQALLEEEGMLMEEEFASEAQSYQSRFAERVKSNWTRPPSARTGMKCLLRIQLVPTGRIVSVTIVEGSGNAAFDRSAMQAVKKVEVFEEVKEMKPEVFERYYRTLTFLFDPQDLRL